MAFQILNFRSIVAGMINRLLGTQTIVTDVNVGGVARTLLEAPAAQIEELYIEMVTGLKEAIPVAVYESFGFDLLPARAATGDLRLTIVSSTTDRVIPAGAKVTTPAGRSAYTVAQATTILAGNTTATFSLVALTAGSVGNLASGSAFTFSPPLDGFVSAANPLPFIDGADVETPDERERRFAEYIRTISRSTVAAIEFGARQAKLFDAAGNEIERVSTAKVFEPYEADPSQAPGYIYAYIHNGVGSTSADLVARTREILLGYVGDDGVKVPGWKAAGASLTVLIAVETSINHTATIYAKPGYDAAKLAPLAADAVKVYMLALDIDAPYVFAEVLTAVMSIPGVLDYIPTAPTANQTPSAHHKIMPGVITVTPG